VYEGSWGVIRSIGSKVELGTFDRPLVGDADRRMRGGGGFGVLAWCVDIWRFA